MPPVQVFADCDTTAPWTLHDVTAITLPIKDKQLMTDREIRAEFRKLIHSYPGYRLLFTDGSKQGVSVSCAFTVNNAFSPINCKMEYLFIQLSLWPSERQ